MAILFPAHSPHHSPLLGDPSSTPARHQHGIPAEAPAADRHQTRRAKKSPRQAIVLDLFAHNPLNSCQLHLMLDYLFIMDFMYE